MQSNSIHDGPKQARKLSLVFFGKPIKARGHLQCFLNTELAALFFVFPGKLDLDKTAYTASTDFSVWGDRATIKSHFLYVGDSGK